MIVKAGQSRKHAFGPDEDTIEIASENAPLELILGELRDSQNDAADYFSRNENARQWWHSLWPGQTRDGRKWNTKEQAAFPWPGASDTRTRTCDKLVGQHETVQMYAAMNMRMQAQSTRPMASGRSSAQMSTLLNWLVFTHMASEFYLELPLLINWRNGYGASIAEMVWEQQRRVDMIQINTVILTAFLQYQGEQVEITDVSDMLADPAQEGTLVKVVQAMSPIVTTKKARSIVNDLRQLRYSELPVPTVFMSQPRLTALRPMVDVFFPANTGNLQRSRWIDRVEWVTRTELTDRIITDGYDADFVDAAIEQKGMTSNETWAQRTMVERAATGYAYHDFEERIQLHHFYYKAIYRGVPAMYCTIFHAGVPDKWGKHGIHGYAHGQYCYHAFRFEKHERPILSSRGIPEIAYTAEQEIKKQRDGRSDRTDLALRPPMLADYRDVLKIKQGFSPGVIWPERRAGESRWMPPPQFDPGANEVENTVNRDLAEYFGLFGQGLDPVLANLRRQQRADEFLSEFKPVVMQMGQLAQEFMPDEEVARVVGPLQRPFQLSKKEIQGAYELSCTVDMREIDNDFLKIKFTFLGQILGWDTLGVIDRTAIITRGMEAVDYTLADMAVRDPQEASNKEITDEIEKVSLILGSGVEQPLPQSGNFALRLTTLTNTLKSTPYIQMRLFKEPAILKALENRALYYQRQQQQQKNAQIGRVQVGGAHDPTTAPMLEAPADASGGGGY